jgi:SAM-dependent methyltransferase
MDRVTAYRLWQAPFAEAKMAPVRRHNDFSKIRRVLDVGCGPGTSTRHFAHADYLGLDFNPGYIAYARRRYGRPFVVADLLTYRAPADSRFDFILANSLFHHIDLDNTHRILQRLAESLTKDGHIHILDLVMPEEPSLARLLARWDRGAYPRPLADWRAVFGEHFEPVVVEPYPVSVLGVTLWNMLYFKGRAA